MKQPSLLAKLKMRLRLEQMIRPFVLANRQREKANHAQSIFNIVTKDLKEKEEEQARDTELTEKEFAKPASNRERLKALMNVRDVIKEIESPSKEQFEWLEYVNHQIERSARKVDTEKAERERDRIKNIDNVIARSKRDNKKLDNAIKKAIQWEKKAIKQARPPAKTSMQTMLERIQLMEESLIEKEKEAGTAKEELKQLLICAATTLANENLSKDNQELKILITAVQELRRILDESDPETEKLCKDIDGLLEVWNKQYTENKSPAQSASDARKAKAKLNQLVNPPVSDRNKIQPPEDMEDLTVLIRYAKLLREQLDKDDSDYQDLKWKADCQISGWEKALESLIGKETDA